MNHTIHEKADYLKDKINHYFENALIDYGVHGVLKRITIVTNKENKNQQLIVIVEEDNKESECIIDWCQDYSAEQIYNIWMEFY